MDIDDNTKLSIYGAMIAAQVMDCIREGKTIENQDMCRFIGEANAIVDRHEEAILEEINNALLQK